MTRVQKELCVWLCVCLAITGAGIWYTMHMPNEHPGLIRLHILANSDLPEDQAVKLAVRDAVLQYMEGQTDLDAARQYIDQQIPAIEETAESVIRRAGCDYPAHAVHRVAFIPRRQYEDLVLPAGNYETLQITLGRGDGQNWWCVLFPRLCLIGDTEKAAGRGVILKSKIREMMQKPAHRGRGKK